MAIVTVEKNRYTVDSLYQWDKDQDLQIYGLSLATIPEIHFTNHFMDKAIVRQATMDDAGVIIADIPNSLLQKPYKITAYVCIYEGETFKTLYAVVIPVEARNKPADYTIEVTDDEVYSFNALENKLENVLAVSLTRYDEVNAKYVETNNKYVQAVEALEEVTEATNEALASANEAKTSARNSANSAKTYAERAEAVAGGLSNADWNENDETLPGYIKNRTHWKEEAKPSEEIFNDSITFSTNSNGLTSIAVGTNLIKVDKTYIITYGGTDYECTAYTNDGSVCLGNATRIGGENDTGEPFSIECLTATSGFFYKNNTASGTETVVIKTKATETVYHKLPKEYLPDDIGGSETIIFETMDFMTATCNKTFEECLTAINNFNTNVVLSLGGMGFIICSVHNLNNYSGTDYGNILYPRYQFVFDGSNITVEYFPNEITITTLE